MMDIINGKSINQTYLFGATSNTVPWKRGKQTNKPITKNPTVKSHLPENKSDQIQELLPLHVHFAYQKCS